MMLYPTQSPQTCLHSLHPVRLSSSATARQIRFYERPHKVTFDQTKKNNDPKDEEDQNAKPQSSSKQESHPKNSQIPRNRLVAQQVFKQRGQGVRKLEKEFSGRGGKGEGSGE